MRNLDERYEHGTDRDGKWSTGTVLMAFILGFTVGFLACHKIYGGFDLPEIPRITE